MIPTLWLSYCWLDNVQNDVDFVAQQLEAAGICVKQDRFDLIAGRPLWSQIGKQISDPSCVSGWALYATENALNSEPVREELAYALDRALKTRGQAFPLIGIFPTSVSDDLIPPSIRARVWVSLTDPDWLERVRSGLLGDRPNLSRNAIQPVHAQLHWLGNKPVLEARPRAGRWHPAYVAVRKADRHKVIAVTVAPSGRATNPVWWQGAEYEDGDYYVWRRDQNCTPTESLFVHLKQPIEFVLCGHTNPLVRVDMNFE